MKLKYELYSGKIEECKYFIGNCPCCKIGSVKLFLFPGEFENSSLKKDHIKIIDQNYFGGKSATCKKYCKSGDFKPLECKTYPYSPFFDKDDNLILKKVLLVL